MLPHPPIPLGIVRTTDTVFLLALGALAELVTRCWILFVLKRKPRPLEVMEATAAAQARDVEQLRAKGPSEFVATSKAERKLLQLQQEIETTNKERKAALERGAKLCKNANWLIALLIFVAFYGVPLISLDGLKAAEIKQSGEILVDPDASHEAAKDYCRSLMFPLSYVGVGVKVSRWGLLHPESSIGALLVYWSSQITISKLMDAVDALVMTM